MTIQNPAIKLPYYLRGKIMKLLSLIPVLLVASTAAAKTKTVSFSYDYDIDYVKVKANVICVTSIDARENGDGEEIESETQPILN